MVMVLGLTAYADAAVVSRPTAANKAASNRVGGRTDARMPTTTLPSTPQVVTTTATEPEPVATPEPEPAQTPTPERIIRVDNKTSMFNEVLSETGANATDDSANARADAIRRQRAMLDAAGNQGTAQTASGTLTANKCDADLRKCMMGKCGEDFSKCANDSTTTWSEKMESCRRNTKCTGHEYALLAPEILADRDMNVRMSYYNSVINCGDRYNSCIFNECGTMLGKCLAKSDGDRAISKCDKIAKECREQDSGLASRVMSVFGDLRTIATEEAKADEARLREIRDLMRDQCGRFGAMFDERSLDCVYTVNFLAGENATPMASKKLYAGDTFQCTPNWFGVDVTTYKENAYRLTRSEKSASSGAMGAGLGVAAGLLSSNAIGRAIATQKADKARQEAEDCSSTLRSTTHVKSAKYDADGNCVLECKKNYKKTNDNLECIPTDEQNDKREHKQEVDKQIVGELGQSSRTAIESGNETAQVISSGALAIVDPKAGATAAGVAAQISTGKPGGGNSIQQQISNDINRFNGAGINTE